MTMSKVGVICPFVIPNQMSTISIHIPSLVKSADICSSYRPNINIQTCAEQITLSKIDEICSFAMQTRYPQHQCTYKAFENLLIFAQVIVRK